MTARIKEKKWFSFKGPSIKGFKEFLLRILVEYKDFCIRAVKNRKDMHDRIEKILYPVKFKKGDVVWLERFSNCVLAQVVEDRENMLYVVKCISEDVHGVTKSSFALVDEEELIKCTFVPPEVAETKIEEVHQDGNDNQ